MLAKLVLIGMVSLCWGCVFYPDPASEPRSDNGTTETGPPPQVEKMDPPKRPATTCPPAMKGSC